MTDLLLEKIQGPLEKVLHYNCFDRLTHETIILILWTEKTSGLIEHSGLIIHA